MKFTPLLVVLTGPSGAGKDSVLNALKTRPHGRYAVGVNATTRPPRPGEREGVDYYFVAHDEFARMIRDGELLEHAVVYGQDKGVPREPVRKLLASGKHVLLRTDVQGARFIKANLPGTLTIFVAPPSPAELEERLRARGDDSLEQVDLRLKTSREELASAGEFDFTVVNDDLERCAREIEEIIERESHAPGREPARIS